MAYKEKEAREAKDGKEPKEAGAPKPYNRRRKFYHGKPGGGENRENK